MDAILQEASQWIDCHTWVFTRIGLAAALGMAVGLEREMRDKPAGLRTMILISVGSCLFAMLSELMGAPNADPARIAAQIVSGVGFLGAGAILRDAKAVYGLTTAATIWMIAAVGMACGFGYYGIALLTGVGTLSILLVFQSFVRFIERRRAIMKYRLATSDRSIGLQEINDILQRCSIARAPSQLLSRGHRVRVCSARPGPSFSPHRVARKTPAQ